MAISILAHRLHFGRFIAINNSIVVSLSNTAQYSNHIKHIKSRLYATSIDESDNIYESDSNKSGKKISKAMSVYLQRAREHDEFIKKETAEYEIGKRHLANMMGEDPEFFTQADINKSIEYLFPSGLFDPKARPMMKDPKDIFLSRKEAEFDETGKPFHSMFYTSKPNYYQILHDIVGKIKSLNDIEDSLIKQGTLPMDKIDLMSSIWLLKPEIEKKILETINDREYNYFITSLERLCDHPLSKRVTDFIMKYRKVRVTHANEIVIPPLEYDSTGRPYIIVKNCMRKSARGEVTIWGNGSGKIIINGEDITYLENIYHREQVS